MTEPAGLVDDTVLIRHPIWCTGYDGFDGPSDRRAPAEPDGVHRGRRWQLDLLEVSFQTTLVQYFDLVDGRPVERRSPPTTLMRVEPHPERDVETSLSPAELDQVAAFYPPAGR